MICIMNDVVLCVYEAISISSFKKVLGIYRVSSISELGHHHVGHHIILEPKRNTDCLLSLHHNHACFCSGSNQCRLQQPF